MKTFKIKILYRVDIKDIISNFIACVTFLGESSSMLFPGGLHLYLDGVPGVLPAAVGGRLGLGAARLQRTAALQHLVLPHTDSTLQLAPPLLTSYAGLPHALDWGLLFYT